MLETVRIENGAASNRGMEVTGMRVENMEGEVVLFSLQLPLQLHLLRKMSLHSMCASRFVHRSNDDVSAYDMEHSSVF